MAATIAITATDIKRVLAYSTVSQLGYMMLALGVGGWLAGMFHLFTHAFFKSLLFLCSGSVIHAVHTNDMPEMGGLRKKMPVTANTMLVGCLAIAGAGVPLVIGLSGYYSKDAILAQALSFAREQSDGLGSLVLRGGGWRRGDDGVLHVPPVVHDVRRPAARCTSLRPRPRVAPGDVRAAGDPGRVRGRRGLANAVWFAVSARASGAVPPGRHRHDGGQCLGATAVAQRTHRASGGQLPIDRRPGDLVGVHHGRGRHCCWHWPCTCSDGSIPATCAGSSRRSTGFSCTSGGSTSCTTSCSSGRCTSFPAGAPPSTAGGSTG